MENSNGHGQLATVAAWNFTPNDTLLGLTALSVRSVLSRVKARMVEDGARPVVPMGHGDPSAFPCFRTAPEAVDAAAEALQSAKYNSYSSCVGLEPARRSIADYLSRDLPNKLSPDDVYLTSGCTQAIEIICSALARPGANILLPRPGYLFYEARAIFNGMEARYFDLLPEKDWEVDIAGVQALADKNTIAMVIVNPGNPCGNVYTYEHLAKASAAKLFCVAETARKLGIFVITDEVYAHQTFGEKKFVPMGVFGSVAPVLTLGAISKRWVVPGWRLGWIVTNDPNGVFQRTKLVDSIKSYLDISSDPATFIQVGKFFGMIQVKLDLSCLQNIKDDMDFCCRLAKEELVVVLPGCAVGYKNWLRITFAIAPSSLEDGLDRLKSFCLRYSKPNK
ncbi:hypothetical protein PR202_gb13208 [Eleusine coracana subsp. coracana]|uniref:Aminotransferase class I/classII large domain-containing protein n=1 Tax=Eleusine coracana subsp. coracana TaxID=191504 RepID=A0AAV5ERZ3_ELECO|nr:hypothetical protein PR202_gb13208 [Eleusine coracana subsp. coracana]